MKSKKRKQILTLLVYCMFVLIGVTGISVTSKADGYEVDYGRNEGLQYEVQDNAVAITGYVGEKTEIAIPETITVKERFDEEVMQVKKICKGAFQNSSLKGVYIPKGITLEDDVFSGCDASFTVYVEQNAESLIAYLKTEGISYEITDSGKDYDFEVCDNTFWGEDKPTYVDIYEYIGTETDIAIPSRIQCWPVVWISIADEGNDKIESVTIPDSVMQITNYAFQNCTNLKKVIMADSVEVISYGAFQGCTSLTEITLSDQLEKIEYDVFRGCTSLSSIRIPENLQSISDRAFMGCTALRWIEIPGIDTVLGDDVFKGVGDQLIVYTNGQSRAWSYARWKQIECREGDPLEDGRISLDKTNLTLAVGETYKLSATVETLDGFVPKVEWLSYDTKVAVVDESGTVTALKEGPGLITATIIPTCGIPRYVECEVTVTAGSGTVTPGEDTGTDKTPEKDTETGTDKKTEADTGKDAGTADLPGGNTNVTPSSPVSPTPSVPSATPSAPSITPTPDTEVTVPTVGKVANVKTAAKKKAIILNWKKAKQASGYEIQISTKKNFNAAKTNTVKKDKVKWIVSKLKAKKKYYIRIRAYADYTDAFGKTQKAYGKWTVVTEKTK